MSLAGGQLQIRGDAFELSVPAQQVEWPERTRHGKRIAHLPSGATLDCANAQAWDDWRAATGHQDGLVVRAQQNWPWVAGSFVALLLAVYAMVQWGVPAAASAIVPAIPYSVDVKIGERVLDWLDGQMMQASEMDANRQAQIRKAFESAVLALPANTAAPYRIVFRKSAIGANAFAIPGGTMVVTDDLVEAFKDDDDLMVGVLAHELGHLRHRHGMRAVVQVSAVGALISVVVGDASSVLATGAAWLGQASYSRDAEREADAESVRVLKAARISPRVMVTAFARSAAAHQRSEKAEEKSIGSSALGIAFASHPADEERRAFFEAAAVAR